MSAASSAAVSAAGGAAGVHALSAIAVPTTSASCLGYDSVAPEGERGVTLTAGGSYRQTSMLAPRQSIGRLMDDRSRGQAARQRPQLIQLRCVISRDFTLLSRGSRVRVAAGAPSALDWTQGAAYTFQSGLAIPYRLVLRRRDYGFETRSKGFPEERRDVSWRVDPGAAGTGTGPGTSRARRPRGPTDAQGEKDTIAYGVRSNT